MSVFGTPAIATNSASFSSGNTISVTVNTASNDLIVVCINVDVSTGCTNVTDTIGNTYTRVTPHPTTPTDSYSHDIWYCASSKAANSSNVITCTKGSSSQAACGLVVYDVPVTGGVAAYDSTGNAHSATSGTLTTSSFSTTGSDEFVVVGAFGYDPGALLTFTAGSGYTLDVSQLNTGSGGGNWLTTGAQHRLFTSTQSSITASMTFTPTSVQDAAIILAAFKATLANTDKSHNVDAFVQSFASDTHNVDASVIVPATVSKTHSVDAYCPTITNNYSHNVDVYVSIIQVSHSADVYVQTGGVIVAMSYVNLAGTIFPKVIAGNFVNLAGTTANPGRRYVQLAGTIKSPGNLLSVNLAGTLQVGPRNYVQLAGTLQNPTFRTFSVDANITSAGTRNWVKLAGTLKQPLIPPVPGGGFPNNSWIKLSGTIVTPGGSIQMPGEGGFTAADDWHSSIDAAAAYKPTSIFNISGGTLPSGGINLIVTAFTCGVVSSQTRTRSWLRLVDAAPSGIVVSVATSVHTLPNGAVITTTTTTTQNQDSTTVLTVIQNSATPTRSSSISTQKFNSGQTVTVETDNTETNGLITTSSRRSVSSIPPTSENIQPLQVKTLDGVIHYQFFSAINPEWAGGEQEGLTVSTKQVQIIGSIDGVPPKRITTEDVTTPDGKDIHTVTEEVIPSRDVGLTTTNTTEAFTGVIKTVTSTTTFPDGTQTVSSKQTTPSGDSVENTTETVIDEYGQVTTTVTATETVIANGVQTITKNVSVTKGGVTTTDTVTTTNNLFEDSIVSTKIKVYFLQEFTITCVIDEQSMIALQGINITHQKNYTLMELFGQQLGNTQLSWPLRQTLIEQFNAANNSIIPVTLLALGSTYSVVFAQAASGFRAKYIPGTEPHVYELQMILQSRSDIVNGTFGF